MLKALQHKPAAGWTLCKEPFFTVLTKLTAFPHFYDYSCDTLHDAAAKVYFSTAVI